MDSDATVAYVCEASIDAISLLLLHKKAGITGNGLYCGIGGVANQDRIDAIKAGMAAVVELVPDFKIWSDRLLDRLNGSLSMTQTLENTLRLYIDD